MKSKIDAENVLYTWSMTMKITTMVPTQHQSLGKTIILLIPHHVDLLLNLEEKCLKEL